MADLYWDPYDEEIERSPYEVWRRMRDEAPVYRNDKHDFYALTRFADVEGAHRDPQTFSSARGTVLEI
ncbi:MAG: cytochrome P450, partial [Actinobacteria bacterium]